MTLANACHAAILHGNKITDIKADKWAETYRCTPEEVRATWEWVESGNAEPPPFFTVSKRVDDE